jgi:single-stranded-DNA-specific exonuclease
MSSREETMPEGAADSVTGSRWVVKRANDEQVRSLREALGISHITARALVSRGITEIEAARAFLGSDPTALLRTGLTGMADPFEMADMGSAVEAVQRALELGVRIRVYGDYDVDGVCATALLVRALRGLAGEGSGGEEGRATAEGCPYERVDWYIPHRIDEGYGVNEEAVRQAHAEGVGLLITVDCGSTAVSEVALARELGMEVVVTDHHRPDERLPDAPVLNPWRTDCAYPFKELAGVGVAFKLVTALGRARGVPDEQTLNFLDLVCLGTVADVVPLLGENRLFVQHGLGRLARSRKVGIRALIEAAGVGEALQVRDVAFGLAPRINAAGRMEDARAAARLLLTRNLEEARELAQQLCEHNEARRAEELRTLTEAEEMVAREVDLAREKAIVLASERWHPGVIGIVASRLVERYSRPVLLIAVSDGVGKGSGRSIGAFNLWEGLRECADLLTKFGGHRYAAGFAIEAGQVGELRGVRRLRERINEVADQRLSMEDLTREIEVDAEASLSELTAELVGELNRLAPFGVGNPAPMLVARGLRLEEVKRVGDGSHVSLRFRDGRERAGGIWFRAGDAGGRLAAGASVDVCFRPRLDEWGGAPRVQLQVSDVGVRADS